MKRITITYDVKNRDNVTGETCMDITVSDEIADRLILPFPDTAAVEEIEKAVAPLESLKGRSYIRGSITDIREAKEQGSVQMEIPREPRFYPDKILMNQLTAKPEINSDIKNTQGCKTQIEVDININTEPLDETLEKANQAVERLKEVQQIINSLSGIK